MLRISRILVVVVQIALFVLFVFATQASGNVNVTACPAPSGANMSSRYTASVDGTPIPIYDSPVGAFGYFSFGTGPVQIRVTTRVPIDTVDVRPKSAAVKPLFTPGSTAFTFSLPRYGNFSIEINGDLVSPLFLFANPPESSTPSPTDPNVIYFGPGTHNLAGSGELAVPSGKTVYIACGAIVRGKIRVGAGKPTSTGANDVTIAGPGIVDSTWLADPGRPLRINKSTKVSVEGPIFLGKKAWGVVTNQSDNVTFANVKVLNWRDSDGTGTPDGMDVVGSSNVTYDHVFVRSYDDAIALKNQKNGWAGNVSSITVKNSVLWNGDAGNALEIGYETNISTSTISNVRYENIDIIHKTARSDPYRRAAIGIHNWDGAGTISGVIYDGIRIENTQENVIWFGSGGNPATGIIRDVTVKNVSVTGGKADVPSVVQGADPSRPVSNVTFENLNLNGKVVTSAEQARMTITNASNVRFVAPTPPPSPPTTQTLIPTADVWVRGNATQCGTCPSLNMKNSSVNTYDRKTFLRFDLQSIGTPSVARATLKLYVTSTDGPLKAVTAYPVGNDSWTESMQWSNHPGNGGPLGSATVSTNGVYIEIDVTTQVNAELGGNRQASFLIYDPTVADTLVSFGSQEAKDGKPKLVLTA